MAMRFLPFIFSLLAFALCCRGQIFFTQAPTVSSNQPTLSTDINKLSDAFRDRLTSGIGDGHWRIMSKAYSLTRDIREPLSFPTYHRANFLIEGNQTNYGPAGTLNEDHPLVRFCFDDAANLAITRCQTNDVLQIWEDGKTQRGWIDATGYSNAPALEAARNWRSIRTNTIQLAESRYLSTFGGWLPIQSGILRNIRGNDGQTLTNDVFLGANDYFEIGATRTNTWPFNEYLLESQQAETQISSGNRPFDSTKIAQSSGSELNEAMQFYLSEFKGANYEQFFTNQYVLAPSRGTNGSGFYPVFSMSGLHFPAGYESSEIVASNGFKFCGVKISAIWIDEITNSGPVTITLKSDTNTLGSVRISPQATNAIVYFRGVDTLKMCIPGGYDVAETIQFNAECAEVLDYKPTIEDAYFVVRNTAGKTRGTTYGGSQIVQNLLYYGCIKSTNDFETMGYLSDHPAFCAVRDFYFNNLRAVTRYTGESVTNESFISYETVSNKSVLWLSTNCPIAGLNTTNAAPVRGFDNQWLFFMSSMPSGEIDVAEESDKKGFLVNRGLVWCSDIVFGSPIDAMDIRYLVDVDERSGEVDATEYPRTPQSPSYFTFSKDVNSEATTNFNKSLEIYKKPYLIESLTVTNGKYRLALTERLQYFEDSTNAPRSDENTLTDFVNYRNGSNAVLRVGDQGYRHGAGITNGAVIPSLYFVRMPPKVYVDTNDTRDSTDTPMQAWQIQQMNFYLKAMAEGWIDTRQTNVCGNWPCFTFENLMLASSSNRWFNLLSERVRNDKAESFGPLPKTKPYFETFNQIANAVNLLTVAPVEIPQQIATRSFTKDVFTNLYDGFYQFYNTDDGQVCTNSWVPVSTDYDAIISGGVKYEGSTIFNSAIGTNWNATNAWNSNNIYASFSSELNLKYASSFDGSPIIEGLAYSNNLPLMQITGSGSDVKILHPEEFLACFRNELVTNIYQNLKVIAFGSVTHSTYQTNNSAFSQWQTNCLGQFGVTNTVNTSNFCVLLPPMTNSGEFFWRFQPPTASKTTVAAAIQDIYSGGPNKTLPYFSLSAYIAQRAVIFCTLTNY